MLYTFASLSRPLALALQLVLTPLPTGSNGLQSALTTSSSLDFLNGACEITRTTSHMMSVCLCLEMKSAYLLVECATAQAHTESTNACWRRMLVPYQHLHARETHWSHSSLDELPESYAWHSHRRLWAQLTFNSTVRSLFITPTTVYAVAVSICWHLNPVQLPSNRNEQDEAKQDDAMCTHRCENHVCACSAVLLSYAHAPLSNSPDAESCHA